MFIHWFPGHMKKALIEMEKKLSIVDSIIYILDARAPFACINESFDDIIKNKPVLYVLNKVDLISAKEAKLFESKLTTKERRCVSISSLDSKSKSKIATEMKILNKKIIEKYDAKGINRAPRLMVLGVPNSGKSTFINSLIGRKKADVANIPGVTKTVSWVRIPKLGFDLLDSPGVLFPDFSDQEKAYRLAAIGSVKDARFDAIDLAKWLYSILIKKSPEIIIEKYKIKIEENPVLAIESIARSRGYILKGAELDIDRAAMTFISDYRNKGFGKLSLY